MNEEEATKPSSPQRVTPTVRQIVIGYSLRANPDAVFTHACHDATLTEFQREEMDKAVAASLASVAPFYPGFGTFHRIELVDTHHKKSMIWTYEAQINNGKKPAAVRFLQYLSNNHPQVWANDESYRLEFIGFDIKTFLTMVAMEVSSPSNGLLLPPRLWLDSSYSVDLCTLIPHHDTISVVDVIRQRKPADPGDADKWMKHMAEWQSLHRDTHVDVVVATELAAQLGLLGRVR